ncbi:nuclear pore complex protein NUP43 [Beta vulgaris subsp. vulgaris]|uniref:nuclear pore complex protein NUP43 n=1 Tax=Beta vulgaris subsp. vulgaris TaxID=3555 RepID=UPI0020368DD4|nr:nuclear pore complex protein NUP43 [Beta vulgaris subsp. vulgaris]
MAVIQSQTQQHHNFQIHRFPQSKYIDAVRWLPPFSAFDKFVVLSLFDPDSSSSAVEIHSLEFTNSQNPKSILSPLSSSPSLSRTSSLKTSQSLIAFSTFSGSLSFLSPNYSSSGEVSLNSSLFLQDNDFHIGPISCIDVLERECVSVGEDGRVNLVNFGGGKANHRRVFDSNGLVSYTAVKWASPMEFATGGLGCSLQWWDQRRKPGEPALQFKNNWPQKAASGVVHSIDIHPSRKHTCMAGGSSGTVFAWDLRWPQQPIILSGVGIGERPANPISESEVWEVQFDCHLESSNIASMSASRVLPVMMCSEEGILAVLEPGAEPIELLEEPCAINSFDIDKQNYSDIICSLEWESIAIISRS